MSFQLHITNKKTDAELLWMEFLRNNVSEIFIKINKIFLRKLYLRISVNLIQ